MVDAGSGRIQKAPDGTLLQGPTNVASCNICKEEAKVHTDIRWVIFYDKSTTKLERHLNKCHPTVVHGHQKGIAESLVKDGKSKMMSEFLKAGAQDDKTYRFMKMCIMNFLPISLCSCKEFNGKKAYYIFFFK